MIECSKFDTLALSTFAIKLSLRDPLDIALQDKSSQSIIVIKPMARQ
jgi:hypothetical protein